MDSGKILTKEDIKVLESFENDDGTAYFYQMIKYLDNIMEKKVQELGISEDEIKEDLELSLRYAYALINQGSYLDYYNAVEFMKHAEKNAKGSAIWYYRYSVAHMYLGKLEEAFYYAEKGASEDPLYPWVWLQVAKLRAHFDDKEGALLAVEKGLELVPDDYEFLTLQAEIEEGKTLEEMEYHWINPDKDRILQDGLDPGSDEKLQSISCMRADEEGLRRFEEIFSLSLEKAKEKGPALYFDLDKETGIYFVMNRAGLSHLNQDWLRNEKKIIFDPSLKEKIFEGEDKEERARLVAIQVFLDCRTKLIYVNEETETSYAFWLDEKGTLETTKGDDDGKEIQVTYYTPEEMEEVTKHIESAFGHCENIFHELVSEDIHVDICMVAPTEEKDYYTIVTMGMGALPMNVPKELEEYKLERAELAIALPSYWKLDTKSMEDEKWYWPIRLLKNLSHIPIDNDSWIGFGHTFSNSGPFAADTNLSGAILINAVVEEGKETLVLNSGKEINFYQVIPLYDGEIEFKNENGTKSLLKELEGNTSFVVDIEREDLTERLSKLDEVMDDASWHLEVLREKKLPVEEENAYNHLTIFLRWAISGDLMSQKFVNDHQDFLSMYKKNQSLMELRSFVKEELGGVLLSSYFNLQAREFISYYYLNGESPDYPSDIDEHALEYFGEKRYFSDEFKNEAYLFVPFDENYYFDMAEIIQHIWEDWLNLIISDEQPDDNAKSIMENLEGETMFFPSMSDDDPIYTAYLYNKRIGRREGFIPVLLQPDEKLLKLLLKKNDGKSKMTDYDEDFFDCMLEKAEGEPTLSELELLDNRLVSYWNQETGMTYPMILARIPVEKPYGIFSILPLGNTGDYLDTDILTKAARYLYEKLGAYPAVITTSGIEFHLAKDRKREDLVLVHRIMEIIRKKND